MAQYLYEITRLHELTGTLKSLMLGMNSALNVYTRNAMLLSVATQSLHIEFSLLELLNEFNKNRRRTSIWRDTRISGLKRYLDSFLMSECLDPLVIEPEDDLDNAEFDIFSTLMVHHVFKEREDGRAFYDLKSDGLRPDNANALEAALKGVAGMDPYYAVEVVEDAISQLMVTIEEMERIFETKSYNEIPEVIERRKKAGRKPTSCFLPQTPVELLQRDVRRLYESIAVDDDRVQLGGNLYDRKYVFVLLYYRFIAKNWAYRKLNVLNYSRFLVEALGLTDNPASFRKSLNNWIQKIDLYHCTFEELTMEKIHNRYLENQLTEEEFPIWTFVGGELDKVIDELGLFV